MILYEKGGTYYIKAGVYTRSSGNAEIALAPVAKNESGHWGVTGEIEYHANLDTFEGPLDPHNLDRYTRIRMGSI